MGFKLFETKNKSQVEEMMSERQRAQIHAQEEKLDKIKPVPYGGWPSFLIVCLGVVLGLSNAYLFTATIPGIYGIIIACGAVCLEITAVWCVWNQSRTTGAHKEALRKWKAILGFVALVHCVLGIAHYNGLFPSNTFLQIYTAFIAFP